MIITAESVEIRPIEGETASMVAMAQTFEIVTTEDVAVADSILVRLANGVKTVKEALKPMRDSTTAAWKAGTDLENRLLKPIEAAKKALSARRGEAVARIESEALEVQADAMDRGEFDNLPQVPEIEKSGVTSREVWSAEVVDVSAFLTWSISNREALITLWRPSIEDLTALARIQKEHFNIPGCKAVKSYSSTVRTGPNKSYHEGFKKA